MNNTPDYVPEWRLDLASWFLSKRAFFRSAGFFGLFIFDIIIVYQLGLRVVSYNASGLRHQSVLNEIVHSGYISWRQFHEQNGPLPLIQRGGVAIRGLDREYDFAAQITNQNEDWGARDVTYHFVIDGADQDDQRTFILPQESKYVFLFNIKRTLMPKKVDVVFDNIEWSKLEPDDPLLAARGELSAEQIVFVPGRNGNYDRVRFAAVNRSPFSFWQAGFSIAVYGSQNNLVGIHYVTRERWDAQSVDEMEAVWFGNLPGVRRVEITPEVNLLDSSSVMRLTGSGSSPPGVE